MIARSVAAQDTMRPILGPANRFLYQSPLYREAVPMPVMSPIPNTPITSGQENYYASIACASQGGQVVQESY